MKNPILGAAVAVAALSAPFAANAADCTRLRYPTPAPAAYRTLDPANTAPVLNGLSIHEGQPLRMFTVPVRNYHVEAHPECPGVAQIVLTIRNRDLDPRNRDSSLDQGLMVINPEGDTLPTVPVPVFVRPINASGGNIFGTSTLRVNVPRGFTPEQFLNGVAIRMTP